MRYACLKKNDIANAPGICVSIYLQGCPHHCFNCFNPETWDFNGGNEFTYDTLKEIISAINENGIKRDLCILGGEPLCEENQFLTLLIVNTIKEKYPDIIIYIWTGYILDNIKDTGKINQILDKTDVIVDGPYIEAMRSIQSPMRGSLNQRILYKGKDY